MPGTELSELFAVKNLLYQHTEPVKAASYGLEAALLRSLYAAQWDQAMFPTDDKVLTVKPGHFALQAGLQSFFAFFRSEVEGVTNDTATAIVDSTFVIPSPRLLGMDALDLAAKAAIVTIVGGSARKQYRFRNGTTLDFAIQGEGGLSRLDPSSSFGLDDAGFRVSFLLTIPWK
jgi:hypothetical protein